MVNVCMYVCMSCAYIHTYIHTYEGMYVKLFEFSIPVKNILLRFLHFKSIYILCGIVSTCHVCSFEIWQD